MTNIHDHPYVKEMGRQIDQLEAELLELQKENDALRHDLERAIKNHSNDLND